MQIFTKLAWTNLPQSSIVAGLYRCVILIDNKFTKNYTTTLLMERPPVAPGQTLITEIKDNKRVVAASSLQPSYEYLGNVRSG